MTQPTRNQIFTALLAVTANLNLGAGNPPGGSGFVSRSRKLRHFDKVPADESPALFQVEPTETINQTTGLPSLRRFKAHWIVYVASDNTDPAVIPVAQLDDTLDALESALKPPPGQTKQTLGGIVHHAFIDGEVIKVPGDDDGQGMLSIPLTVLAP